MNVINHDAPGSCTFVMATDTVILYENSLYAAINVSEYAMGHRVYSNFKGQIYISPAAYSLMVAWSTADTKRTGIINDTETRLDSLLSQASSAVRAVISGDYSSKALIEYDDACKRGNPRRARAKVTRVYDELISDKHDLLIDLS
jgi:hypothetical protein